MNNSVKDVAPVGNSDAQHEEIERKARVDAVWEQMNKGKSVTRLKSFSNKPSSTVKKTPQKSSTSWMTYLGLGPNKTRSPVQNVAQKEHGIIMQNGTSDEEAKKLAAAALSAVKDAAAVAASASSKGGKVEITEVRDFAGEEIEYKKLVEADSKEASEKGKAPMGGVDAILEQIKKKPKLSVLDKTKKDWGEYKDDNRGLEDELDAYKKSSNQYLDKVNFLQRTDYREFERERDARLALQARRRPDNMQDD